MVQALATNNYGPAKWIVDATLANATHSTIAAALTSASSGDTIFIRTGSYTENLTLKAGVNLTTFSGDSDTPNVTIIGKATFTGAGTVSISNINLQTNSDFFLVVSGSSASIVNLDNCFLNCLNNTGISFTTSNGASEIFVRFCQGNIGTTGIALFASSSAGTLVFQQSNVNNTGASTTASTISAGILNPQYSKFFNPITTSGTSQIASFSSTYDTSAQNVTALTCGGSNASNTVKNCYFGSGTNTAVSIGSNLSMTGCEISSSNAAVIAGAGTLTYTPFNFSGTGQTITTSTQTPLNYGTWVPTVIGASTAGTTTYTTQQGTYTIVGNTVYVEAQIVITAATGTGNALFGTLPFTVKNLSNYKPIGMAYIDAAGWAWSANTGSQLNFVPVVNGTTATFVASKTSTGAAAVQVTNAAATFRFNCWYQI